MGGITCAKLHSTRKHLDMYMLIFKIWGILEWQSDSKKKFYFLFMTTEIWALFDLGIKLNFCDSFDNQVIVKINGFFLFQIKFYVICLLTLIVNVKLSYLAVFLLWSPRSALANIHWELLLRNQKISSEWRFIRVTSCQSPFKKVCCHSNGFVFVSVFIIIQQVNTHSTALFMRPDSVIRYWCFLFF